MKKLHQLKNWIILLLIGFTLLALTGVLFLLAKYCNGFFNIYTPFSIWILRTLGSVTGIVSFSCFELLVVLLFVIAVTTLIVLGRKGKLAEWGALVFACICLGIFLFTALWGLNHLGPSIGEKLNFHAGKYTTAQLQEATEYYMEKAGETADLLDEAEDGTTVMPSFDELADNVHLGFDTIAAAAGSANSTYNENFVLLANPGTKVKPLLSSRLYAYMGITGIFIAFTGEPNVSTDTYKVAIPFTMCHETAHRLSFAAENEANFIAFITCEANEKPEFQYSGYYLAYIYCFNSLYAADPTAAAEVSAKVPARLRTDLTATNKHYAQFDGKVQKAAEKVNDSYLKAFGEEDGVKSYGMVTDYLIEWYLRKDNEDN